VAFSYGSYAAHVAEVSVTPDGQIRVHKLVCAIDCGIAVNPDQVRAQMEGGAVYAMTGLFDQITLDKGRVQQSNFHDYPMLESRRRRWSRLTSSIPARRRAGLGEPGVPPVAPSILQRGVRAHRQALRTLPFRPKI